MLSTKTMSDMDLNIRFSIRFQSVPEDPQKSKAENLVHMTDVVNGILEGMGMTSHIAELRQLLIFDCDKKEA